MDKYSIDSGAFSSPIPEFEGVRNVVRCNGCYLFGAGCSSTSPDQRADVCYVAKSEIEIEILEN